MDGLSATASVIAVIQLTERVVLLCSRYVKAAKNARSDIERLQGELRRLSTVLDGTRQLVEGRNGARLNTLQLLRTTLNECSAQLSDLESTLKKKLETGKRGRAMTRLGLRALEWPFQSDDVEHTIQSLTKFQDTLSTGLNIDQTRLFLENLERLENNERRKILEWVSPILYGKHHDTVKEARTSGTCEWLLQHERFQEWEGASSSVILWLQGFPGAGKTFLTSKVIDHVQNLLERSPGQEGFAFFYCNRNEEERRKPLSVLRSYVRQLSTTPSYPGEMRKKLRELWREMTLRGSELSLATCREQLLESVNLYQRTTLVLDALDECDPGSRRELIDALEFILSKSEKPLKVFISSRPDRDIRCRFVDKPSVEIEARHNAHDIKKFVQEEVVKHGNWKGMTQLLQEEIVRVLLHRSEGMFQWVFLQTRQILELETEAAIRDRLGRLPTDLTTTYDEIYGRIKARNKHDRSLADRALKWVMCACQPLTSEMLLSAIRLDPENDTSSLPAEITESQLLHLCNNLLLLDSQRGIWRFSHLSVAEYFEEKNWSRRQTHCHGAITCLKLLMGTYDNSRSGNLEASGNDPRDIFHQEHPLQLYARRHWIAHVQTQEGHEPNPELARLLKAFLGSLKESSLQYRRWHRQIVSDGPYYPAVSRFQNDTLLSPFRYVRVEEISPEDASVFVVCRFSFYTLLSDWWADAEIWPSTLNSQGDDLLTLAAIGGCIPICEALMKQGIQVNMPFQSRRYGSALAAAASRADIRIIRFLVQQGAGINMLLQTGHYGSALAVAASRGDIKIVRFLVQQGADVNMLLQTGYYGRVLKVVACGYTEVIELLLEHGVDVNWRDAIYGRTMLSHAAEGGNKAAVKLFLANAAVDPNLRDNIGRSPLAYASREGHSQIVRLLSVTEDVEIDTKDHYGLTPLSTAVRHGRLEVTKLLLATGRAASNCQDCFGRTPLWYARRQGNTDLEQLLLDSAKTSGMSAPETDVPSKVGVKSSHFTIHCCDICTLGITGKEYRYICKICNGGQFIICLECYESGGRCLEVNHELVQWDDLP